MLRAEWVYPVPPPGGDSAPPSKEEAGGAAPVGPRLRLLVLERAAGVIDLGTGELMLPAISQGTLHLYEHRLGQRHCRIGKGHAATLDENLGVACSVLELDLLHATRGTGIVGVLEAAAAGGRPRPAVRNSCLHHHSRSVDAEEIVVGTRRVIEGGVAVQPFELELVLGVVAGVVLDLQLRLRRAGVA